MGLKLLTLALCSVEKRRVKVYSTADTNNGIAKKASVIASYDPTIHNMRYALRFSDGTEELVHWSPDNQGYVLEDGVDFAEAEDTDTQALA